LSNIVRLVGVLGGSGFLHCLVGWLGVTAVRCYGRVFFLRCIRWPLQVYCYGGGVRLWCWYVRRASGFHGVIGMSLIEGKIYDKTCMRGQKKNFKCYTYMCTHVHIFIYVCGSNEANVLTFNVVHSRCWCPLCHVITLDRHCVCRTASVSIQCRGVGRISCEVAV